MLKNIQAKIVLIFMVIGIIIISAMGYMFILQIQKVDANILANNQMDLSQIHEALMNQENQVKLLVTYALGVFLIICILVGIFVSKVIINPISELIKNAGKIANGENVDIKYLTEGKSKNEVDELSKAFGIMTTELKENLNEVTRQKKQIETILLHMTDGVVAFNMEGKILHINNAAKEYLNIKNKEDFEDIFEKLNVDINMEKIIYLENWTSSEQRVNIGNRYLNLFFAPFKDENDRPAGVIVVTQDITQHVKLDNMQKEFVADVSHELKTPITSIMGYADTLLEGEYEKETQNKFLNVIASEARRMARLVTDLLTLSRYDNNKIKTEKTEFNLGELVKECSEKVFIEAEKKNQKIETLVTSSVPLVYADKYGIERVVLNIITNAIKYTKENGNIKIYVGFVFNDAYIKVIDNGMGIPEKDLKRIFERFYRVDKARTREMGGTGLGLSIAKEILDKNNGAIDIKSEVGKGTEVVIKIPTKKEVKNS